MFKLSSEGILKEREQLSEDDSAIYENHPRIGLNMILERKVPLNERIKNMINYSHGVNLKTFELNRLFKEKIPVESELIMMCEALDKKLIIKKNEMRKELKLVKSELLDEYLKKDKISSNTIELIKKVWLE